MNTKTKTHRPRRSGNKSRNRRLAKPKDQIFKLAITALPGIYASSMEVDDWPYEMEDLKCVGEYNDFEKARTKADEINRIMILIDGNVWAVVLACRTPEPEEADEETETAESEEGGVS
jgi:hypothetical protein